MNSEFDTIDDCLAALRAHTVSGDVSLNGLAFASGDPGLTLTVADEQERGLYTLMTEAPSFNESITILNQNGAAVGTLVSEKG